MRIHKLRCILYSRRFLETPFSSVPVAKTLQVSITRCLSIWQQNCVTGLWQRNGTRWVHRASHHTGQYNKSEHFTRRQTTTARYACFNSWWDMKSSLIKNEKQQTGVQPAPRRVPGSLHTRKYLVHRRTVSLNESCLHVTGGRETVSFPPGSGVWCRINHLRR